MKLWTHHPSTFQIDDPLQRIDWTKGQYWTALSVPLYRSALYKLQSLIGETQFLWCCTTRGQFTRMTDGFDLAEWELDVPFQDVLAWLSAPVWEEIIRSEDHDWRGLILTPLEQQVLSPDFVALVRFPLAAGSAVCQGQLPAKYPSVKG